MAYYRKGTDKTLLVAANYQNEPQDLILPEAYKKLLMNNLDTMDITGKTLHMSPFQVVVFEI